MARERRAPQQCASTDCAETVAPNTRGRRRVYCSDRCRNREERRRARARRPRNEAPCAVCGDTFTPRNAAQHHCSDACRRGPDAAFCAALTQPELRAVARWQHIDDERAARLARLADQIADRRETP